MSATRERKTGRYTHRWGWQGYDAEGREWSNCDHCGRWRAQTGQVFNTGPERTWDSPEPGRRTDQYLIFGIPLIQAKGATSDEDDDPGVEPFE